MMMHFGPLKHNAHFRFLYAAMMLCVFGGQMYLVALPYQIYHLTGSTLWVGLLSLCELIPMILMGLLGGAMADRFERRKLILVADCISILACMILAWNAQLTHPKIFLLFVIGFIFSASTALVRPALGALTQAVIGQGDFKATSSLMSFGMNLSAISGPALTGLLIAHFGFSMIFCITFVLYSLGAVLLLRMKFSSKVERTAESLGTLASIREGLKYAASRQELMGSYVVDMVAMIFGMPNALFPALAQRFGGASIVGLLYAAPAAGAVLISLFSGWTKKIRSYGKAVIIAAFMWGLFIVFLGLTHQLILALVALALAGAADAVSGIFRSTLWNETIPNHLRGRLAGIEMISYMSGPALGNTEAGLVASAFGVAASVLSGGLICMLGVVACARYFPAFWHYKAPTRIQPGDGN
jgi:MFS family permease